jgi:hypothetical protein
LGYLDGVTSAVQTQLDAKAIPANVINNTLADAKGDLITATADNTPARLAVGSNGDTLVADSSTSTGLRYQGSMAAGRNGVINGGFDIWQRGTSFIGTGYNYTADRWVCARGAFTAGGTFTRQAASDANLPNIQYAVRMQRDAGNTATASMIYFSAFESANSIPFAGKTVTLSFYARKGANYSVASSDMSTIIYTGTGTDEASAIMAGWTGVASTSATQTLTTSWQRFSITATLGTGIKQIGIYFTSGAFVGTAGANDWLEVTGVQLEQGSVATAFSRAGATIQGELAACQRYYFRYSETRTGYWYYPGQGSASSTTRGKILLKHPIDMRVNPTSVDYNQLHISDSTAGQTINSINIGSGGIGATLLDCEVTSGLTQYRPYFLLSNNSVSSYVGLSAEL